jgi:hypothetical protein
MLIVEVVDWDLGMDAVVTSKKCLDVELALASVVVHVADSAKHSSFVIRPVVNSSNAPILPSC